MSAQEKEKLRKNLQKLFQNHCLNGPTNRIPSQQRNCTTDNINKTKTPKGDLDNSSNKKKNHNNTTKNINKTETPKGALDNSSNKKNLPNCTTKNINKRERPKGALDNSSNKKKLDKCEKKVPDVSLLQNGCGKASIKQNSQSKFTKSKDSLKEDKPKSQKKTKPVQVNEKVFSKSQNNTKKSNTKMQVNSKTLKKPTKTKGLNEGLKKPGIPKTATDQKKKDAKSKSSNQQNNSVLTYINVDKSQSKKAQKRIVLNSKLNNAAVANKKQKLIQKGTQKDDESDSSSSQYKTDYDENCMAECVPGGDSDNETDTEHDSEEDDWMKFKKHSESYEEDTMKHSFISEKSFESDKSSNKSSKTNTEIRKFKDRNKFSDSEEENSDSDDDFEAEDYNSDSLEEEDEDIYSGYEDHYEEEEDSYDYTSNSEYDYSTDYDESENDIYDYSDSDKDYELPDYVPEDLIIHKGTCSKRDLEPEDNVSFDSDHEGPQIVELENQQTLKIIKQPKECDREELLKLKFEEKSSTLMTFQKKELSPKHDDCPELVPIVDADGFQLYNPCEKLDDDDEELENCGEESVEEYEDDASLGSEYTEIDSNESDSLLSEDINEKYFKRCNDTNDSDDSIDENVWMKTFKADVIDATGYEYENSLANLSDNSEVNLSDDIKQTSSVNFFKNIDLKTGTTVLSTTVIDNMVDSSNDTIDTDLSPKLSQPQEIVNISQTELKYNKNSSAESPKVTKPYTQNIANYNTKFFNAFNSNLVIVVVKDPFYIYGTVRLTLLAGSMEVYGHSLKLNTEVEIFSPRGCSVIEICSLPAKNNISNEKLKELLKLYEKQFALNDLKTIVNLYSEETDAVVLLKRNEERKKVVQQYKKFMNENVFPNINNINAERPLYNSEYLLRCMINISAQEQKCLRLPKDWQQFKLTSKSRVMLAGGKSVGKSTLLRYLINRHLPQKVLLIDLDIGQPEVFIPQTVSCTIIEQPLLGPGFLLNLQPEISFVVGHTNIALCAHKYMSAVRELMAYCKEQDAFKDIPWLINTMGYNKGFGLELISVLVQEPLTDVIQLQSSKEINNFESTLQADVLSKVPHILFPEEYERIKEETGGNCNYRLHIWQSAVQQESRYQKEWEMSAKDLRFAILLARLSQALQGYADWLTDVKPLSASLNDLKMINLMDNAPLVSAEELEKAVEANLVYLCHYEDDPKPLKCLGIGVVRAIDFHVRHLYLTPALPYTQLKDVNCLAIGEMPLPTSLFINQGPRIKNIVPFVYNTVAASASKAIKQIYHRPAKFLTGKHKSLD